MENSSKLFRYLLTSLTLASVALATATEAAHTHHKQHNLALIIDLDDIEGQEENLNLTQADLSHQICANDACILASASTLQRMINAAHKIGVAPGDPLIEDAQRAEKLLNSFELYTDGFFWLLLPNTIAAEYKESINPQAAGLTPVAQPKAMKISAAKTSAHSLYEQLCRKSNLLLSCLQNCFKKDGHDWNIYIRGHGDGCGRVCGMADVGLKKLLDFFGTHLNTRTLVFSSCYGGGEVINFLFPNNDRYPYLIICQGLGENVLYGVTMQSASPIFKRVSGIKDTRNLNEVIDCLPQGSELADSAKHMVFNSFQIRLPQSSSFVASEMVDAQGKQTTLTVNANTSAQALQNQAQVDLILDTIYEERPISLYNASNLYTRVKGEACHYLATINASTLDKPTLIQKLSNLGRGNQSIKQTFLIKKIQMNDSVLHNCMVCVNHPNNKALVSQDTASFFIFYQLNGQGFIETEQGCTPISSQQLHNFLDQFERMQVSLKDGARAKKPQPQAATSWQQLAHQAIMPLSASALAILLVRGFIGLFSAATTA